jgi:hypothetical protein
LRTKLLSQLSMVAGLALFTTVAQAQTWSTLTNRPPAGVGLCMLLTDGGVLCQANSAWYKLTPNSALASFPSGYNPYAYSSAVLADGRVVVVGGEYNNGNFVLTNRGAIYNPKTNAWALLPNPPVTGNPDHLLCLGDAPAIVLADGRFLVGSKLYQDLAVLDPATLTWSIVNFTGKIDGINSEEGWTLLPDNSFFTLDVRNAPASERFLLTGPTTGVWVSSGNTVNDLHTPTTSQPLTAPGCPVYNPPGEVGPTLLLPNGKVFAVGASGFTGVYTPPAAGTTDPGSWIAGPSLPSGQNVEDGPGAVLPNGHALFGSSPGASTAGLRYYEYNPDTNSLINVAAPARAASDATYFTSLLVLPSGETMFVDGSTTVQLYTGASSQPGNAAWAPTITQVSSVINNAATYPILGTQFNGLTHATAFGDESQNSTNYPLVRITNTATGHVFYARTHDHSSMGVATGNNIVSTNFDVPANIEAGASTVQVVANGIASAPVAVMVVSTAPPTVTSITPNFGPIAGGTVVTIAGTNFDPAATVSIGGVAAVVSSATPSSITATTGARTAAGAASVVVTNPSGAAATLTNGFTYRGPAPTVASLSPNSGPSTGGTSVIIAGNNFSGSSVTFGGTAGTVTARSATSLTVTAPAHAAGLVSVVVTNSDGQSATLANSYTYVAVGPTITGLSPTSGSRFGGTSVTISGSGFVSGAVVTFGGTRGSVQSISATSIRVRTPSHSRGTVPVVVTNPNGQSATRANAFTFN